MMIMTISEMTGIKEELGLSYAFISEISSVPVPTVQKIFTGETKRPRYQTLQALTRAFDRLLADAEKVSPGSPRSFIEESMSAYGSARARANKQLSSKKQGEFTVTDYYNWPDDERIELIDGVIYDMTAPTFSHQTLAAEAYRQISNYILNRGGGCRPFVSPVDVQLDCDSRTMVQPDVVIICDPSKMRSNRVVFGAPDFALEVLSPSTSKKDLFLKREKYRNAGVREFWIVDPSNEMVIVYLFDGGEKINIYPLFADIPVALYGGDLVISFKTIQDWLQE